MTDKKCTMCPMPMTHETSNLDSSMHISVVDRSRTIIALLTIGSSLTLNGIACSLALKSGRIIVCDEQL